MKRRIFLELGSLSWLGLPFLSSCDLGKAENLIKSLISSSGDSETFDLIRKQLLLENGLSYLNTGSLGTCLKPVIDIIHEIMIKVESDPVSQNWGPIHILMEEVRDKTAHFINAEKDELILTRNTTEGMSSVGASFKLNSGDEILTTNHEHQGGLIGWEFSARNNGAVIKQIEMPVPIKNKAQILELIEKNITHRTKVCSLSHITTITGLRMPMKEISEITRPRDILLVCDGAQAAGMIDVDVKDLGVDVYATSGHKWLMAPKETGYLYIRKEVQERIQPVFMHSGYNSYSHSSGTRNAANIIGLGLAIDIQLAVGKDRIEKRCLDLSGKLYTLLNKITSLKMLSPEDKSLRTAILSTDLNTQKNSDIKKALEMKRIIVKLLPKYNALRFSMHYFITDDEINTLTSELDALLG